MKGKLIKLEPVHQTGHNCKTTAIATIDKHFGEKLGFTPIPLHKEKVHPVSIRELSKAAGSVQGELLEAGQFSQILGRIGYETELVDVQDDFDLFQDTVTNNIAKGNLVIACFAVDRKTGAPTTAYDDNEHPAILHGFDTKKGTLQMTHWDQQRKTTMRAFYDSSMSLLSKREPEYYASVKDRNRMRKYDLTPTQTDDVLLSSSVKKSIVPKENTGYRGKLIVVKQPQLQQILEARNDLKKDTNPNYDKDNQKKPAEEIFQRGQLHLIANLNKYFESQDWPFRVNPEGICLGLAILRCKYVFENREDEYYKMLDIISNYDQLKDTYDDRVNHFVTQALMAYQPNLFTNKKQRDAFSMLKIEGKEILRFNMITSLDQWNNTLESLDLQMDEVMILQTPTHAMSVTRTPFGKYRLADPNHSKGYIDYDDPNLIMKHIKINYPYTGGYGLDVSIVRSNKNINTPRNPPLPTKDEIYKNVDILATTESSPKKRSLLERFWHFLTSKEEEKTTKITQMNFACRFDNLSLFSRLFKKFKEEGKFQKGEDGLMILYEGLLTAAKNDSSNILQGVLQVIDADLLPRLADMAIKNGSYRVFNLFATDDKIKDKFKNIFTEKEATKFIYEAATGGNPDILKEIINIYSDEDEPSLTQDELAEKILTKFSDKLDAIEAAIGSKANCGISNTESVSILLEKVMNSNHRLNEGQLLHYTLLAVKTNQPHLVKLFADTIKNALPKASHDQLFQSIKLSVTTAEHTDYSILKVLEEHGTEHSKYVKAIMNEKAERSPGIMLTIGIQLQKFTDWVMGLSKEKNMQHCKRMFMDYKQRSMEQQDSETAPFIQQRHQ